MKNACKTKMNFKYEFVKDNLNDKNVRRKNNGRS